MVRILRDDELDFLINSHNQLQDLHLGVLMTVGELRSMVTEIRLSRASARKRFLADHNAGFCCDIYRANGKDHRSGCPGEGK